jgi:hypothetical protein
MQIISNRYEDVEHLLLAGLLAANADTGPRTERPVPVKRAGTREDERQATTWDWRNVHEWAVER